MRLNHLLAAGAAAGALAFAGATAANAATSDASWTGAYVGAVAGAELTSSSFALPGDAADVLLKQNAGKTAFFAGGFVGFNKQINNMVVGIEGDLVDANKSRSVTACNVTDGCWTSTHDSFTTHNTLKETLNGHVRVRAGVAEGQTLFYVAGGYSVLGTRMDLVGDCFNAGSPTTPLVFNYSRSQTLSGFNVGAGVEQRVGRHLLVRAEYLFDDYGHPLYRGDGAEWNDRRIGVQNHNLRVGVAYKF
jgi:outer membrane immunogenic protein